MVVITLNLTPITGDKLFEPSRPQDRGLIQLENQPSYDAENVFENQAITSGRVFMKYPLESEQ